MFRALRIARYRRVWYASLGHQVGMWMQITGRAVLIFQVTGSTSALGAIYFFSYIPQLLFSQLAGIAADRFDRRRLLIAGQSLAALGAFAMGVLAITDTATVLTVGIVSFLIGAVMALLGPVGQAIMPSLVPRSHLSSAISISSASSSGARIVGPLLAGAMIPLTGVEWLFWVNAIALAALVSVWVMTPLDPQPRATERKTIEALGTAIRFVKTTRPVLVPIVALAFISAVGLVYQPLGIAYAEDILANGDEDLGSRYYGIVQAAIGIGSVIGILLLARSTARTSRTFIVTAVGFSASLAALGMTDQFAIALLLSAAIGAFQFANATLVLNIVQHATPEVLRGRVMSIHMVAWIGLFPVTSWISGVIADRIGVMATLSGAGIACLAFCTTLARWLPAVDTVDLGDDGPAARLGGEKQDAALGGEKHRAGDGSASVGHGHDLDRLGDLPLAGLAADLEAGLVQEPESVKPPR